MTLAIQATGQTAVALELTLGLWHAHHPQTVALTAGKDDQPVSSAVTTRWNSCGAFTIALWPPVKLELAGLTKCMPESPLLPTDSEAICPVYPQLGGQLATASTRTERKVHCKQKAAIAGGPVSAPMLARSPAVDW